MWLLRLLGGHFTLLAIDADVPGPFSAHGVALKVLSLSAHGNSALGERYLGAAKSAIYLIRPDQHVAARFEHFDAEAIAAAVACAIAKDCVDA
jgi:3-(3-hydroxy-phenyl)propionate hydroxylase